MTKNTQIEEARKAFEQAGLKIYDLTPPEWWQPTAKKESNLVAWGGANLRVLKTSIEEMPKKQYSEEHHQTVMDYLDALIYMADEKYPNRPVFAPFRRYAPPACHMQELEEDVLYLLPNSGYEYTGFREADVFRRGESFTGNNLMTVVIHNPLRPTPRATSNQQGKDEAGKPVTRRIVHMAHLRDPFLLLKREAEALSQDDEYRKIWLHVIRDTINRMGLDQYRYSIMNSRFTMTTLSDALERYARRLKAGETPYLDFDADYGIIK